MTIDNKRAGDIITLQMAVGPPRNPANLAGFRFYCPTAVVGTAEHEVLLP